MDWLNEHFIVFRGIKIKKTCLFLWAHGGGREMISLDMPILFHLLE